LAKNSLIKELELLEKDQVIVIVIGAKEYLRTNLKILSYLVGKKGHECVYLSMNRPYENLVKLFEKNDIDQKKFFFIDTISKTIGGKTPQKNNVLYIDSPHGLTNISIALSKALESLKAKERFLFFDSISTMLIYNKAGTVTKFAHFIAGRTRAMNIKGILVSLEKETEQKIINQMAPFVDDIFIVDGKE